MDSLALCFAADWGQFKCGIACEFGFDTSARISAFFVDSGINTNLSTRSHYADMLGDHHTSDRLVIILYHVDPSKEAHLTNEWLWNEFDAPQARQAASRINSQARKGFGRILTGAHAPPFSALLAALLRASMQC